MLHGRPQAVQAQIGYEMSMRKIDVWFGIGGGESIRIPGELDDDEKRIIITDRRWLDWFGWNKPSYSYPAQKLDDTFWVSYDDYKWSEIGFVPENLLVKNGSIIGTDELHPPPESVYRR